MNDIVAWYIELLKGSILFCFHFRSTTTIWWLSHSKCEAKGLLCEWMKRVEKKSRGKKDGENGREEKIVANWVCPKLNPSKRNENHLGLSYFQDSVTIFSLSQSSKQ